MSSLLLVTNARILTMDPARPTASALLLRDGRIAALDPPATAAPQVDLGGRAVIPAFIDAHCHLLAFAASFLAVDCSPAAARSIADIQMLLRARAATTAGGWIRGMGYDETALAEGRHPTRHDLDAAVPHRPVRLKHRSGHASVLNSAALATAGIDIGTEEPPGGFIDRDVHTGEPTGLLLEMEEVVDRVTPPLPYEELASAVSEAGRRFLAAGVTAIQDATHTNGPEAWDLFARLLAEGRLPLHVTLMEGIEHLGQMPAEPVDGLRRGAVKIVVRELGDELHPEEPALTAMVVRAHAAGRQVAIHAVGERAVLAAVAALEKALAAAPRPDHRHRIEHCSLLPEGAARRLARLGVAVVTQPAFLYHSGDRYLAQLAPAEIERLYAVRSLAKAGVPVALSSDAPVTPPAPLIAVAAASQRRSCSRRAITPTEAIGRGEAIAMHTAVAAWVGFADHERGMLRPGLAADFLVLSGDPREGDVQVQETWLRGRRMWPETAASSELTLK